MYPMNQAVSPAASDELTARLEDQERAYRERKARRAYRSLAEVAGQLRARLASKPEIRLQLTDTALSIVLGAERAVEMTIKIAFDHSGDMQQWFVVREQFIRRDYGYEEIDRETMHEDLAEATRRMLVLADLA